MFNSLTSRATFYDLTGYLIPGLVFLGVGWATCYVYGGIAVLDTTIAVLDKMGGVVTTLALIAAGYVLGHFMNAISSFLYEEWWLRGKFMKAKDWQGRLAQAGKSREDRITIRAKKIFGVKAEDLQGFELRIRAEEKMPQSFIAGFCFLSFYGMSRTISLTFLLALPLAAKYGWDFCNSSCNYVWVCKLFISTLFCLTIFMISAIFAYQYLRFVKYYYDYLGSTLLYVADGEKE